VKELVRQSGYVLDLIHNIWVRPNFGVIPYDAGDQEEKRIAAAVASVKDRSLLSPEWRDHCTDWPSRYHLSATRANLLRPFEASLHGQTVLEVGAGCGALTRYLGECGADVVALEASPTRAAIARERTHDLKNVTVVVERLDEFDFRGKFDVVTLVGVLEYAGMLIRGADPALTLLYAARALLKPEGRLIVAIENQFGLKYFAGAAEDHLGEPMLSIEGRYRKGQPVTWGRRALDGLLETAGFAHRQFLAPYPDYKLPVSIVTEAGFADQSFDAAAFAWQSVRRDPQLPPFSNFSMELAWPGIIQNRLGLELSNSFLIVACGRAEALQGGDELAYHYSVERAPRYCKEAVFRRVNPSEIKVRYRSLAPSASAPDDADALIHFVPGEEDRYIPGRLLASDFVQLMSRDGWSYADVARLIWRFLEAVKATAQSMQLDVELTSPRCSLPGVFLDHVFGNIITDAHGVPYFFDREWELKEEVELGYVLFRSFLLVFNSVTRFGRSLESGEPLTRKRFLIDAMAAAGLAVSEDDLRRYADQEALVQARVADRSPQASLDWAADVPLLTRNLSQAFADKLAEVSALTSSVHERDAVAADLNGVIEAANGRAEGLERSILERDAQVLALTLEVAERDKQILELNAKIDRSRREHVSRLGDEIVASEKRVSQLQAELAERDQRFGMVVSDLQSARGELGIIRGSTSWRAMTLIQRIGSRVPVGARLQARRVAKGAWWAVTPHRIPARLRFLKARRLALEARGLLPGEPIAPRSFIGFEPNREYGLDGDLSKAGHYTLGPSAPGYSYIPLRKPDDLLETLDSLNRRPLFSIVVPLYNTPADLFHKMVGSVLRQWYPDWELILVDDKSPDPGVRALLATVADERVQVVLLDENKGISGATNEGIARARGDYIAFLDHDDEYTDDCLYELALCANREDPDYMYSDEDKISSEGRYEQPFFKPDWSPDTMMSTMYTCHVSCVRRALIDEVGGLRSEFDGGQDWDFVLRVVERARRIAHIPKVLYHWRIIPASVASNLNAKPYAIEATRKAREEALTRRGLSGKLEPVAKLPGHYRVRYEPRGNPLVSIVIPSKNNGDVLKRCIDTILERSSYRNFEIVLMDNGTTDRHTRDILQELRKHPQITIIEHDKPFNYSEINNVGARAAKGEMLLFLNDDTEVITQTWLDELIGYAQLPHVAAVGAKLLYPEGRRVQHSGIVNLAAGPGHAFLLRDADDPCYFARNLLEYNWIAVTGACLMIERSKFEDLSGFDESFPIGYNDIELCFRLIERGLYNVVCPGVELVHHESLSRGHDHLSDEKRRRLELERQRLYQRHPHLFMHDPYFNVNLAADNVQFSIDA
jgi:O-antigen biosynthesis protein